MVLSATLTQDPSKLAQLDLHHPLFLTTGQRRYQLPENLRSYKLLCEPKYKPLHLVGFLKSLGAEKCVVFTSSVESTHLLCTLLNSFHHLPFKIKEYSSLQRQSIRRDVEGVRNVIICLRTQRHSFIHRAGRTARAGQTGRCFTLLRKEEVKRFNKLLRKAENNSRSKYSVPSSYIEPLHTIYESGSGEIERDC